MGAHVVSIVGVWHIDSMPLWDRDYLDLERPAHFTFGRDRLGSFQFGAVAGYIDYRVTSTEGLARVEFSWEGFNDSDASSGRGFATLTDGRLEGRLFFHNGDDSGFVATRLPARAGESKTKRAPPKRS